MQIKIYQVETKELNIILDKIWKEFKKNDGILKARVKNKEMVEFVNNQDRETNDLITFFKEFAEEKIEEDGMIKGSILLEKEMKEKKLMNDIYEEIHGKKGDISHDSMRGLFLVKTQNDYLYLVASGYYISYISESKKDDFGIKLLNIFINVVGKHDMWTSNRIATKDIGPTNLTTKDETFVDSSLTSQLKKLDFFELLKITQVNFVAKKEEINIPKEHSAFLEYYLNKKNGAVKIKKTCATYFTSAHNLENLEDVINYIKAIDVLWKMYNEDSKYSSKPLNTFLTSDQNTKAKDIKNAIIEDFEVAKKNLYIFPTEIETYYECQYAKIGESTYYRDDFPIILEKICDNAQEYQKKSDTKLTFFDSNNQKIETQCLSKLIHGELKIYKKNKFIFEGKAYVFEVNYLDEVHRNLSKKITKDKINHEIYGILYSRKYVTENDYLVCDVKKKWKGNKKIIVGHPYQISKNGYELFDLWYKEGNKDYLIFCKTLYSMGAGMRDIAGQVERTVEYIHNNKNEVNNFLEDEFKMSFGDEIIPVVVIANPLFNNEAADSGFLRENTTRKKGKLTLNQGRSYYLDLLLHSLERLNRYGEEIIIVPIKKEEGTTETKNSESKTNT